MKCVLLIHILFMHLSSNNMLATAVARKRYLRIALLPFLVPIFLIGWALAHVGEKADNKKRPSQKARPLKEALEIGLLTEEDNELQLTQTPSKKKNTN
jgi:hypothetical protein